MKLQGVTLDFNDVKSCGLKPDMCIEWDRRSEELSENPKLLSYWDKNIKKLLSKTKNVVISNVSEKSMVYSADKTAIELIKKFFKEMTLKTQEYEDIKKCKTCVEHDYLKRHVL